jgi:hypothetical protein
VRVLAPRHRGRRMSECLAAFRELQTKDNPSYGVRYVKFSDELILSKSGAQAASAGVYRRREPRRRCVKASGVAPRHKLVRRALDAM